MSKRVRNEYVKKQRNKEERRIEFTMKRLTEGFV